MFFCFIFIYSILKCSVTRWLNYLFVRFGIFNNFSIIGIVLFQLTEPGFFFYITNHSIHFILCSYLNFWKKLDAKVPFTVLVLLSLAFLPLNVLFIRKQFVNEISVLFKRTSFSWNYLEQRSSQRFNQLFPSWSRPCTLKDLGATSFEKLVRHPLSYRYSVFFLIFIIFVL